jgi:hypothetical protein
MHLCIRARKPFQPTKQAHQVSESIEKQVVKDKGGGKGGTEGGTKSTRMESTRTESTRIQLCASIKARASNSAPRRRRELCVSAWH